MTDNEDDRPDWREIDRKRDRRSSGGGAKEPKKDRPTDRWEKGRRKEALDRLFMGEKGTVEHDKFYRKIHSSYGSDKFTGQVKKYFEKYGPPDDPPTLILVLDIREDEIISQVFEKIKSIYNSLSSRHKEDIKRKLSIMALTDKAKEIRIKAEEFNNELV
ncbi:MAG: hypothetical protein C0392_05405 [Syntrophus sp. (in: bacteria)]|nr:hypothetical protein [Syntrophus sp. (in: bacteria)]